MLSLTREERKVVLFFCILALVGLGLKFARKINPSFDNLIRAEDCRIKIDINQAQYGELLKVKGIGPVLAKNIISHRNSHGPFQDLEGLKDVKGIGDFKYDRIKDYITIR